MNTDLNISGVDRENHTVQLEVNGGRVTVICAAESNPTIYEEIKTILVRALRNAPNKSASKLDKTEEM